MFRGEICNDRSKGQQRVELPQVGGVDQHQFTAPQVGQSWRAGAQRSCPHDGCLQERLPVQHVRAAWERQAQEFSKRSHTGKMKFPANGQELNRW
jgi:hypothetical protein